MGRTKNENYEEFVEKFKPKKTTDDCYTPPEIYEVIQKWACEKFGINPEKIVRPFWPGWDYQAFEYPEGCVVLDNPPFSILTPIVEYYLERKIDFFLFAPTLASIGKNTWDRTRKIITNCRITYENGAAVPTSFITNFGAEITIEAEPELTNLVNTKGEELRKEKVRELPKYDYPNELLTVATVQKMARYGIPLAIHRKDCMMVRRLDAQKEYKKSVYGAGLLLSEKAAAEKEAAEKEAAEKAAAIRWELSPREMEIVRSLG